MAMRPSQMELLREKEKAQRERARLRTEEKDTHFPVFSPPRRTEKDDRIEKTLGPHSATINFLTIDNVGISNQPQTPLPDKSSFFDSHKRKTENKKNGYKQFQQNLSSQKPPAKIKPSEAEFSKSSQNSTESSKPNHRKPSDISPDSSKSQSHLPKPSINIQSRKEVCVHSKSKKPTKQSSQKSPHSSSSSSEQESNHVKSTSPSPSKPSPNEKPKPLGNSTKQFPPPNGINRPQRSKLPNLVTSIANEENEVHKDVDAILQEMTNLKQPLTAISTPQKDEHFPFPNSIVGRSLPLLKNFPDQLNKIHLKSSDTKLKSKEEPLDISLVAPIQSLDISLVAPIEPLDLDISLVAPLEPLDISLVAPIEPLITPPETPIKPLPKQQYTERKDDVTEDLIVSESEDEAKDEVKTMTEGPSRKDPCKGKRAPVKEPRKSMSSDESSSGESENETDSSSDDSDSSSEEEEEEIKPKKVEKEKNSDSQSWSLTNFMSKVGEKFPKPPSVGSDDRNVNDELMEEIVQKIIESPVESFTANKCPNSIEKSPYRQPHSHSSSQGGFHSPPSVQSTPSKSSLKSGITPSKKTNSDNSDSEIDVVNTPLKRVSLLSPNDQVVAKCLNFDSHSNRQTDSKQARNKRRSSSGSIIGSLSSDDEEEEAIDNDNNNDSMCNLQEIIHSVGTNQVPLSPLSEKVPRNSPRLKTDINKDYLKYNDGKPSIVVRLDMKKFTHLLDKIRKLPIPGKIGVNSICKDEKEKLPYPVVEKTSTSNVIESCFQDNTANTEPVEMDLDTDSEMANGHIEDYTKIVTNVSSSPHNSSSEKCSKYSDKFSIKRKQNEGDKLFPKRRKSMPKTTNKSTETAQQEKDSHEDDHKWDRKHPHRSGGGKDRLRNSSSSSQTDTEKPSEFELVETNSDAHPSSVETIFNREGDGEIIHEPVLRKPIRRPDEPLEPNEFYLSRAKELKHQADSLTDRTAKYLMYTESMLSFILCGCAMEKEESKATDIYRMYLETFKWLSHIFRMRPNADTPDTEKKLAVLIFRIQSVLCFKLYKLKKNETLKFKKIIDDHNKSSSSKPPAHAPSPHWNNRSTPSPMSPSPSPAGSVDSVLSQSSGDYTPSKLPNGNISRQPAMSSPGTIAVPQRIHSITQQYLCNIHNVVQCHEFWDQAESVYSDNKEFYEDVDVLCGELTINTSVPDLVYYVQNGLQKIKDNT